MSLEDVFIYPGKCPGIILWYMMALFSRYLVRTTKNKKQCGPVEDGKEEENFPCNQSTFKGSVLGLWRNFPVHLQWFVLGLFPLHLQWVSRPTFGLWRIASNAPPIGQYLVSGCIFHNLHLQRVSARSIEKIFSKTWLRALRIWPLLRIIGLITDAQRPTVSILSTLNKFNCKNWDMTIVYKLGDDLRSLSTYTYNM